MKCVTFSIPGKVIFFRIIGTEWTVFFLELVFSVFCRDNCLLQYMLVVYSNLWLGSKNFASDSTRSQEYATFLQRQNLLSEKINFLFKTVREEKHERSVWKTKKGKRSERKGKSCWWVVRWEGRAKRGGDGTGRVNKWKIGYSTWFCGWMQGMRW